MFNKRFIEELFKPQEVYSKKALRTVFDRLAHASIMRLNTASMDKVITFLPIVTLLVNLDGQFVDKLPFYAAAFSLG